MSDNNTKEVDSMLPPQKTEETSPDSAKTSIYGKPAMGVNGEQLISSFYSQEVKTDNLGLRDYRRMKDNDGQVQMLLNAIYNTILSAGVTIRDDSDLDGKEESEEKKFIEDQLFKPRWKNGMSTDFDLTCRTMLRAFEEGFRVFEVLYRVDEDGKIRLDKLAPRASRLSDRELQIITDDVGNFYGFHQQTSIKSTVVDVFVVNDSDIAKTINVVYGEEYGSNYGRPAIKSVFYHYDKLHKALYLNHVGHELGAIKFRHLKKKTSVKSTADEQLLEILQRTGIENVVMYDENKYEILFDSVSDAQVMEVGKKMIDYHTSQMAKALLAQFVEYGTGDNSGNRALGESSQKFFKIGLQAVAKILIEKPWNRVIADIIKVNFDRDIYPRLEVNPIDDNSITIIYDALKELIKSGRVPQKMETEMLGRASDDLGLDINTEELEEEIESMNEQKEAEKKAQTQMLGNQLKLKQKTNLAEDDSVAMDSEYLAPRPLYNDEKKVKIVDIRRKMDQVTRMGENTLLNKLFRQRQKVVDEFLQASRKGRKSVASIKIKLAEEDSQENTYSDELLYLATEMMEYGKMMAAAELSKAVPVTSKSDRAYIEDDVAYAVDDQQSRLELRLKSITNDALVNGLPENELEVLLDEEFNNFFTKIIQPTLGALVPKSLNRGRNITFNKYSGDIFAYRYTAILDGRTTQYCRELDGRVFQATDPDYIMLTPPNHFGCRSIWTPITVSEQEVEGVRVSGKPSSLPIYGSISSFKDETSLSELEKIQKDIDIELREYEHS